MSVGVMAWYSFHVPRNWPGTNDPGRAKDGSRPAAAGERFKMINEKEMEYKIKELLGSKLQVGELDFLRGFYQIPGVYRYSIRNSILIAIQGGSIALGFDRWQKLGRHVKRGERANISILVPNILPAGKVLPRAGQLAAAAEDESRCVGFFDKKVFDITQTEGKPLEYKNNSTEVISCKFDNIVPTLAVALKIHISTAITGSGRGYYSREEKKIVISSMSNNSDQCKTLFHELGHYILAHDLGGQVPAQEVEAELVSFLTCSALGVEFRESPLYIKSYNENKPSVRVLKVISAVQKILKSLEADQAAAVAVEAPAAPADPMAKLRAKKYRFINDPGHGWLEVPQFDILTAGIQSKISGCSYIHKGNVYLEEDCDAGLFIDAVKLPRENCIDVYVETTKIRDYQSYNGKY